jgi:hypothetical protein
MSPMRVPLKLPRRRRDRLERDSLAGHLSSIDYEPDADEQQLFEQAGLGGVLPLLLGLDQDLEFALCHDVALHRLGTDPDPGPLPL